MAQLRMRAWEFRAPGPIERTLRLREDAPRPNQALRKGQILVEVASASINPVDYKIVELGLISRILFKFPRIPGFDFSGRVVEVGEGVSSVKPGDAVFGLVRAFASPPQGTLSQFILAEEGDYTLVPDPAKAQLGPPSQSQQKGKGEDPSPSSPPSDSSAASKETTMLDQAAGLGTAGLSAYQSIVPYVKGTKGARVFINGGSGGVGTFGIQIAKAAGCHVTVTCSTAKVGLCRSLGADEVIDYKTTDVIKMLRQLKEQQQQQQQQQQEEGGGGDSNSGGFFYHVVDNITNSPAGLFNASELFLRPGGTFVSVGGNISAGGVVRTVVARAMPRSLGGVRRNFVSYMVKSKREDLAQLARWVEEGKVRTVVDSLFGFDEVPQALAAVKKGSSAGKVIVRVK